MRILVTGCLGFIGQHLCRELEQAGYHVLGVDKRGMTLDELDRPFFSMRCDFAKADMLVASEVAGVLDLADPDVVIHLAAQVGRQFGEDDVLHSVTSNAGMTAMIAQACGERGVRLVYASTSEVYGEAVSTFGAPMLCVETMPHKRILGSASPRLCHAEVGDFLPHNVYGLSKRWGEEICRLYAPEDLTIWRISMPYGTGLPAGRGRAAIINMLYQADHRLPIPVHRGAERSWCHVSDTVRAMRLTLDAPGTYNIGRDDAAVTMYRVAEIACELTGAPTSLIEEVDPPARQTVVKRLATERIRALGWSPQVELVDGMTQTLEWVRGLDAVAA